jgi:hypothetical protein
MPMTVTTMRYKQQRHGDRYRADSPRPELRHVCAPFGCFSLDDKCALGLGAFRFRGVWRAPIQDSERQDVVEDLVTRSAAFGQRRGHRPQNPQSPRGQLFEQGVQLTFVDTCVRGQVAAGISDLGTRRSDELSEHTRGDLLPVRGQLRHHGVLVGAHDVLRATKPTERVGAQLTRSGGHLLFPQPGEYQLQVGRFDPVPIFGGDAVRAALTRSVRR